LLPKDPDPTDELRLFFLSQQRKIPDQIRFLSQSLPLTATGFEYLIAEEITKESEAVNLNLIDLNLSVQCTPFDRGILLPRN
jgi:hypothetical protein